MRPGPCTPGEPRPPPAALPALRPTPHHPTPLLILSAGLGGQRLPREMPGSREGEQDEGEGRGLERGRRRPRERDTETQGEKRSLGERDRDPGKEEQR